MLKIIKEYPTKTQYVHQETDYDCLLIDNQDGTYGIYVGLPPRHQYWKRKLSSFTEAGTSASLYFLNLNYASFCEHSNEETGVCHIPIKDKKTRVWWVGYTNVMGNALAIVDNIESLAYSLKILE